VSIPTTPSSSPHITLSPPPPASSSSLIADIPLLANKILWALSLGFTSLAVVCVTGRALGILPATDDDATIKIEISSPNPVIPMLE
jgi:hypothetical protein